MMSYAVYNTQTTQLIKVNKTIAAAKATVTRLLKSHPGVKTAWCELQNYYYNVEGKRTVKSLMTGRDVEISVNTPHCCDPSSETYWSM
jgi:hypothetical protein